jgi:hypothetical protein
LDTPKGHLSYLFSVIYLKTKMEIFFDTVEYNVHCPHAAYYLNRYEDYGQIVRIKKKSSRDYSILPECDFYKDESFIDDYTESRLDGMLDVPRETLSNSSLSYKFIHSYKPSFLYEMNIRLNSDGRVYFSYSVPKFIYGHNLNHFPYDQKNTSDALRQLIDHIRFVCKKIINVDVYSKDADLIISRIDLCRNFKFTKENFDTINFLLSDIAKHRKKITRYNDETYMYKTNDWSVKIYNKSVEFEKHDFSKIQANYLSRYKVNQSILLDNLLSFSKNIWRLEVTLRNAEINKLFWKTLHRHNDISYSVRFKYIKNIKNYKVFESIDKIVSSFLSKEDDDSRFFCYSKLVQKYSDYLSFDSLDSDTFYYIYKKINSLRSSKNSVITRYIVSPEVYDSYSIIKKQVFRIRPCKVLSDPHRFVFDSIKINHHLLDLAIEKFNIFTHIVNSYYKKNSDRKLSYYMNLRKKWLTAKLKEQGIQFAALYKYVSLKERHGLNIKKFYSKSAISKNNVKVNQVVFLLGKNLSFDKIITQKFDFNEKYINFDKNIIDINT